ncbi:hypothetical protein HYC85_000338, partial [Camellia sinensis]
NLRWNKLQDVIPLEIGELKSLTHLYLSFNNFKGEIPKELANLPLLRCFYLHENREFHQNWALCNNSDIYNLCVRTMDVGNNHLVGTIRELIRIEGCFPSLRNFYLNNNYLTGGIPAQLANSTNLEILHLSYNKMSGYHTIWTCSYSPIDFLDKFVSGTKVELGFLFHRYSMGQHLKLAFIAGTWIIINLLGESRMYIEGNAFRPGVNPIGIHNVLEVSDTEFLF